MNGDVTSCAAVREEFCAVAAACRDGVLGFADELHALGLLLGCAGTGPTP